MEKSPLRSNNSKDIALNQVIGGANKSKYTAGGSGSTSITYQSVNKKVKLRAKYDTIGKRRLVDW